MAGVVWGKGAGKGGGGAAQGNHIMQCGQGRRRGYGGAGKGREGGCEGTGFVQGVRGVC